MGHLHLGFRGAFQTDSARVTEVLYPISTNSSHLAIPCSSVAGAPTLFFFSLLLLYILHKSLYRTFGTTQQITTSRNATLCITILPEAAILLHLIGLLSLVPRGFTHTLFAPWPPHQEVCSLTTVIERVTYQRHTRQDELKDMLTTWSGRMRGVMQITFFN